MSTPTIKRVVAGLAAGVVGILIVLTVFGRETLADYADPVVGGGLFGASLWNVQGSTSTIASGDPAPEDDLIPEDSWADHDEQPAEMRMPTGSIRPGAPVYALFSLRLAPRAGNPAEITMSAGELQAGDGGVVTHFQTRAVFSPAGRCDPAWFPADPDQYLLGGPGALVEPTAAPVNATFTLDPGATTASPGAPQTICFEFGVADAPEANGATIDVRWTFDAQEVDPEV